MLIFKALHILTMFGMVTLFLGGEIFFTYALWKRDIRSLAWLHNTARRTLYPVVALAALAVGVVFGLLTVATGGLDFLEGWLIAAYVLVAAFFVNSFVLGERVLRLAREAVEADAGTRAAEEVADHIAASGRVIFLFGPINALIFGLTILDMVLKPF